MRLACMMMDIDQANINAREAYLARNLYTLQQFEKLQAGMCYNEVLAIMGEGGREVQAGQRTEPPTRICQWRNSNGSYTSVLFQDDSLVGKVQVGLE